VAALKIQIQYYLASVRGARLLLFAAMAAFLTILGPFGTYTIEPYWARAVYWFTMIFAGAFISIVISMAWVRIFKSYRNKVLSWHLLGLVLVTSIPITILVALLGQLFSYGSFGTELLYLFFYVFTITAAISVATQFVDQSYSLKSALAAAEEKARQIHSAHSGNETTKPTKAFAFRLSPTLKMSELISISSDDHYLHVIAGDGREQIRCTLAEAADELADIDGRVIHRSHWVAHTAIERVAREGTRAFVCLKDGRRLPISRNRLRDLQGEGWLPRQKKTQKSPIPSEEEQDA
jgi:LytTr DNA-binding domain-containing protein